MHGGRRLKSTQTYTQTFGRKVANLYKAHPPAIVLKDPARKVTYQHEPQDEQWTTDAWDDANIADVRKYLERRRDKQAKGF